MKKEILTIAGGNSTMYVEVCPQAQKLEVARDGLKRVEQVGFISRKNRELEMMGGELSINDTIGFASLLGGRGKLKTSGVETLVEFNNDGNMTTVKLRLPYQTFPERPGTVVLFEGIGYLCTDKLTVPGESIVRNYWSKYNKEFGVPAFGLAMFQGDNLSPYVYVPKVDSLVLETACGSGSVALAIVEYQKNGKGLNYITQPTLERIEVFQSSEDKYTFWVSAKVRRIGRIESVSLEQNNERLI